MPPMLRMTTTNVNRCARCTSGHTHRDEFQLSYSDYQNRNHTNAVAMSYIASSLTPTSGHPSFRVYDGTLSIFWLRAPFYPLSTPILISRRL